MVSRFGRLIRAMGGRFLSLQRSPLAQHLSGEALLKEMRVWTGHRLLGGGQAVCWMAGRWWFLFPLPLLARIPPLNVLIRLGYGRVARNRHCFNGQCRLPNAK